MITTRVSSSMPVPKAQNPSWGYGKWKLRNRNSNVLLPRLINFSLLKIMRLTRATLNLCGCGLHARWNREISDCIVCAVPRIMSPRSKRRNTAETKNEIMDVLKRVRATVDARRTWTLVKSNVLKRWNRRASTVKFCEARDSCSHIIYASNPKKETWTADDLFSIVMEKWQNLESEAKRESRKSQKIMLGRWKSHKSSGENNLSAHFSLSSQCLPNLVIQLIG